MYFLTMPEAPFSTANKTCHLLSWHYSWKFRLSTSAVDENEIFVRILRNVLRGRGGEVLQLTRPKYFRLIAGIIFH